MKKKTAQGTDADSRSRLIQTAASLFAEKGFDGVSTRDIAAAAHVNISLISYYFRGKEGLYLAVLEDFTSEARARMLDLFDNFNPETLTREIYRERMQMLIRGIVEMKFRTPYVTRLIHREILAGMPRTKTFVNNMFESTTKTILAMMGAAQKKGFLREDLHLPTYMMTMVHALDGYFLASRCDTVWTKLTLPLPEQIDEYCKQMNMIFIDGVMK